MFHHVCKIEEPVFEILNMFLIILNTVGDYINLIKTNFSFKFLTSFSQITSKISKKREAFLQ